MSSLMNDFFDLLQIDTSNLTSRMVDSAPDFLARMAYEPLAGGMSVPFLIHLVP